MISGEEASWSKEVVVEMVGVGGRRTAWSLEKLSSDTALVSRKHVFQSTISACVTSSSTDLEISVMRSVS